MRKITIVALAAVLALSGAACGGDDDSSEDEIDATADGGDDGGDDGVATDDIDPTGLIDDDCEFLLAGAFLNPLAAAQTGDGDFEAASEQLQAIADEAPDEIKDAMSVLADAYVEIAGVMRDIDFSDPEAMQDPDVQEKLQQLDELANDEYDQAGQEVSAWIAENCDPAATN